MRWIVWFLLVVCLFSSSPVFGFKPFRSMFKAAKDERAYRDQARDERLALALKQRLALSDPSDLFSVSAHVYMGHAFLVGTVQDQARAEQLVNMARGLDGIQSVDAYLVPDKDGGKGCRGNNTDEGGLGLGMQVSSALRADPDVGNGRFTAKVVESTAVLMGVARDEAEREAVVRAAGGVSGITAVKDFILLPEAGTTKRFHILN